MDEATLNPDGIGKQIPTLDDVLNDTGREGYDLVEIIPVYGTARVKVVWRAHQLAVEK